MNACSNIFFTIKVEQPHLDSDFKNAFNKYIFWRRQRQLELEGILYFTGQLVSIHCDANSYIFSNLGLTQTNFAWAE